MADYNDVLNNALSEIGKDQAQKTGAMRFLASLKSAMNIAAALNVPCAGTASMLIGLADAGMSALDGNGQPIDLDKLYVTKATDDLRSIGVSEDAINKILSSR